MSMLDLYSFLGGRGDFFDIPLIIHKYGLWPVTLNL